MPLNSFHSKLTQTQLAEEALHTVLRWPYTIPDTLRLSKVN